MTTEIFIENQQLDISADIAALFTFAVDDVANIGSRETGFSKTVVFPGTGRNNSIFGHAFEFTAYNPYDVGQPNIGGNFNATKPAKCLVLCYGVQIFKGVLRLMKIRSVLGAVEYETQIIGELGGLMGAIGNKLLTGNTDTAGRANVDDDLDFSSYNQNWNFLNIIQSWADFDSIGGGYGVFFPLIDYGEATTNQVDYEYHTLRPALYVHEYLVKIIEKTGYTFECPFFETAFFKRLIIPHNEDAIYKLTRVLVNHQSPAQSPFLRDNVTGVADILTSDVMFSTVIQIANFTAGFTATGVDFTYNAGMPTILAGIFAHLDLRYGGGQGLAVVTCSILKNGTAISSQTFNLVGPSAGNTAPATTYLVSLSLSAKNVTLTPGDVFKVTGTVSYPGVPSTKALVVAVDYGSSFLVEANQATAAKANYNDLLQINNCIPKGVLQRDFFLSIVKMFNLYIVEDQMREKHLKITPFPDFFRTNDPLDWSHKVDRSKEIALTPMSEVNSRYFNFLYEKDSDYYNDTYYKRYAAGYADRTFDTGLYFYKEKKDVKIIFAPSPLVGYAGKDKYVTRILKIESSGAEKRTESKIRILQVKRLSVASWNVLDDDGVTVKGNTAYYGYAGHVNDPITPQGADLNFGAPAEIFWEPANAYTAPNLFNVSYSIYMAEITDKDSKMLTCYMRLAPEDIQNLDFSVPILIDGQVWRLNKIIDYDAVEENTCKIELLKVINLSY